MFFFCGYYIISVGWIQGRGSIRNFKSGKIQAILELAKSLDISLNDIVSFGDDVNDIEMLQICGTGIAVSNAVMDVKAVADDVTLSNDADGVADWIEKNVLEC